VIRAVDLVDRVRLYTGEGDAIRAALELCDEALDDSERWTALDLAGQLELVRETLRAAR
jgi:hypothetical protein